MRMVRALAVTLSAVVAIALPLSAAGQSAARKCGSDRRAIKTRYVTGTPDHEYGVPEFLALSRPERSKKKGAYQARLIEGGQEGRVVSLRGWLHGAAFSADDSDYHVQISAAPDDCDQMVVVEIPDDHCVYDKALAKPALKARRFIDRALGKSPTTSYRRPGRPVEVVVTGQLFYDLHHENAKDPGGGRGKGHCKAGGLWEVHPVTMIAAASQ